MRKAPKGFIRHHEMIMGSPKGEKGDKGAGSLFKEISPEFPTHREKNQYPDS